MITKLTIRGAGGVSVPVDLAKPVKLSGHKGCSITNEDDKTTIRVSDITPVLSKYDQYVEELKSLTKAPYVGSISSVHPSYNGMLWILGDLTSQVDLSDDTNTLYLCDMSQTVDIPSIYRAVYDMLHILRLWVDGHKDSLLLTEDLGNSNWDAMNADRWLPAAGSPGSSVLTGVIDDRPREEIPAMGPALNLLNEYYSTVALWNHIVSSPDSDISVRLHPADRAGIYVGIHMRVQIPDKKHVKCRIEISCSYTGQTGADMWTRVPVARCVPAKGTTVTYTLSGESLSSSIPSILDNGRHIYNTNTITPEIMVDIPESETMRTSYTVQTVVEAIPFYRCTVKEKTYADSKRADHYEASGENEWNIAVKVYRTVGDSPEELVETKSVSKNTAYAAMCEMQPDPEEGA